jgi:hypothetical protein
MSINPFEGTPLAESWQQGFTAGFLAPAGDHSAPLILEPEQIDAYNQGVETGRASSNLGFTLGPVSSSESVNVFAETTAHVGEIVEIVGDGIHLVHVIKNATKATEIITASVAAVFWFAVLTAVLGPNRSIPFFDQAANQLFFNAISELQTTGIISSNLDFFMAACDRNDHGVSNTDIMTQQGWWYGPGLFPNFDQARAEALNHEHLENTRVLRFQTVDCGVVEMIKVS